MSDTSFERDLGIALRDHRRDLGLRRRHLIDGTLTTRVLRAAERGRIPLGSNVLTQLLAAYMFDLSTAVDDPRPRPRPTGTSPADPTRAAAAALRQWVTATGRPTLLRRSEILELSDRTGLPAVMAAGRLAQCLGLSGATVKAIATLVLADADAVGVLCPTGAAEPRPDDVVDLAAAADRAPSHTH